MIFIEPRRTGASSEQAHISAEQPSSPQEARLPAAHAHPGRPGDPVRAAPQGPHPRLGLTAQVRPPFVMLPSRHRMRRRADFTLAVRRGRRAGRPHVVVHLFRRDDIDAVPQVGFVVGRVVGGAVVRNKVRRRLRHLAREHVARLPRGSLLVVRANPSAGVARQEELARELDSALRRLLRPERRER
jgi:ribonuclease P protein component